MFLGAMLRPSWGNFGASWAHLGLLERSWDHPWAILGPSWAYPGASWAQLGASWGQLRGHVVPKWRSYWFLHGFAGFVQATHGQHNRLRAPGSIGAASYPARVFKGMRMAGRMGNEKVTVQNLRVLKVVSEKNLILLKGCVPGHKNSYVIIRK